MVSPNASESESARGMAVALPTSYATYVDRWAIVVGISHYKDESLNLEYADRDAESLYELLLLPSGEMGSKQIIWLSWSMKTPQQLTSHEPYAAFSR